MSKVCLVVIYNHNYVENVPVINRLYAGRFSHIYHVMPFYKGKDPHIIGVYECSYQFHGYITQAAAKFIGKEYSHYVFVADDMVIRFDLNEFNIVETLKLNDDTSLIGELKIVTDERFAHWHWARSSLINLLSPNNACEGLKFLPSAEKAQDAFDRCGMDWRNGVSSRLYEFYRKVSSRRYLVPSLTFIEKFYRLFESQEKVYPLAYGYSDIFVASAKTFDEFCYVCGILAGMRVFVEVAIPTALVLTSRKLVSVKEIGLDGARGIDSDSDREQFEKKCCMSFKKLMEIFPDNYLYIHPIKLSKWKDLP